ncbi:MAG: hypothetical protein V1850_02660 [Candidatus Bathyarchaeota archaeon]
MVDVIYEPWKAVVIHEVFQHSLEMLMNLQSLGVPSGQLGSPIYWANGVAYVHLNLLATEEVLKEYLQGKIHWRHLHFAYMPKYQKIFTIPDGSIRIPIIDMNGNDIAQSVTTWIKKNYKE